MPSKFKEKISRSQNFFSFEGRKKPWEIEKKEKNTLQKPLKGTKLSPSILTCLNS